MKTIWISHSLFIYSPFKAVQATVVRCRFSQLTGGSACYLQTSGLVTRPVKHLIINVTCMTTKLLKMCSSSSIVLIALQILPQRNKNRITLRSNLCYTHQLLSRSTSRLIQKGQIIRWMSGCCTP